MSALSVRPTCKKLGVLAAATRIALVGLLIFLTNPVTPARADTSVCGIVSGTWTSGGNNYIVTCNIQVSSGTTLTIESGVVVKFNLGTSLRVDGTLIAQGATFTTNGPTPAMGDWGQIFFTATSVDAVFDAEGDYVSGSTIQDSLIEWGGEGTGVNGEVETVSASPFLDGNTIRTSNTRGIYAVGRSSAQKIRISNNSIMANARGGVYVSAGDLRSNTLSLNVCGNYCSGGYGAWVVDSIMIDNLVTGNGTHDLEWNPGAGILAYGSLLTNNTVTGNFGAPQGGGIYASGGSVTGNTVTGNRAVGNDYYTAPHDACGGGVYATASTLEGNIVSGNTATGYSEYGYGRGGGICATLSELAGNEVSSNAAIGKDAYGGGIYTTGSTVGNNNIWGNTATTVVGTLVGRGGGVYAEGGLISNNTVSNNSTAGGADNQGGGIYGTTNTVSENTLTGNNANRGGAIYSYKGTVIDNTILTNTTTLTGTVYIDQGTATGNTIQANTAVYAGGMYGYKATLTGNIVHNNTANVGAGIYALQSTVRGNTVTGNEADSDGGGMYVDRGTVTDNRLTGNIVPSWGHGSGAYLAGAVDFSYNSVLTNTVSGGAAGGIAISGQPQIRYNNLYGNQPYDAEILSADAVTGTLNYWGLSVCTSIPGQIYDGNDVPGRGKLSYAPSLYLPVPIAQLDAPSDLGIDIGETIVTLVTLSWTPITSIPNVGCRPPGSTAPDLGYRVYYSIGDPCGPYDGTGLPAGNSPIDVGYVTSYVVNGLTLGDYYFVVAAYDFLGRESAFTNSVLRPATGYQVFLPLVLR